MGECFWASQAETRLIKSNLKKKWGFDKVPGTLSKGSIKRSLGSQERVPTTKEIVGANLGYQNIRNPITFTCGS